MDRTAHRLSLLLLTGLLCGIPAPAMARCISPLITPAECDFKDEDTALWFLQPGWKINGNHRTDTLMENASQSVDQYLSSVKTIGDAAIREHLVAMSDAMGEAIAATTRDVGLMLANDPWNLKPIYLDISRCIPFWEFVYDQECPTTAELPTDITRIRELRRLRESINQIKDNPYLILGEEWGSIGDDIQAIKDEFKRTKTLGRNLDPATRIDKFQERFHRYEQMLAEPSLTLTRWASERREISATLQHTLRDTVEASKVLGHDQLASDREELYRTNNMNRHAIGRMQAIEIDNMNKTQSTQAWLKITEQVLNTGNLMALDMADQWWGQSTARAKDAKALFNDPLNPTIVGNEQTLPLP